MLHKLKKILSRAVPALLLCCMFMMLFSPAVFTVSAAGADYKDYITDITVSGHNDIVEIRIPAEEQYFILINETQGWSTRFDNGYLDLVADGSGGDYDRYTINLHCFPDGRLNLQDIPDGTQFTAGFFYSYSGPGYETPYVSVHEQYYSSLSSSDYLGQIQETIGFSPVLHDGSVTHHGIFNKTGPYTNGVTGSAEYVDMFLRLNNYSPLSKDFVMLQAQDFVMTMTISSLYELQQTQEKTNQILEAVEAKLEQNGQKLDDILSSQDEMNDKMDNIINGEVDPELPNGSDSVTDLDDAEGALRDDAQAGLDEGTQIQQSSLDILGQYVNGFAVFSKIFARFSDIPFVNGLLSISLSLGLVSSLINIGFSAAGSSRRSSSSKGKNKGG